MISGKTPQKVLFVDHLTRILAESLPDLWRLGQTYLSGKLLKGVSQLIIQNKYLSHCGHTFCTL